MFKSPLIFVLFALMIVSVSARENESCLDEYRCTDDEVCWNGECVRKDPYAARRRHVAHYGYDIAKKSKSCDTSRDCRGHGFGYVCSRGSCRPIHRF